MTKEEDRALARPDYWDGRYARGDGEVPTHEWFRSFEELEAFLRPALIESPPFTPADNPLILHLGSGDSLVPDELASRGYNQQLCVDFSPVVVDLMSTRHADNPSIEWKRVDVRDMRSEIADKSVAVAFDKGTLDAMIHGSPWSPPEEVKDNTSRYMAEVHRVLKDDGVFLYITYRQPHFIKPLLNPSDSLWNLDMQVLGAEGSFGYYGYKITKKSA